MEERIIKRAFVITCNSRLFGIAKFLLIADRFDDAYAKIEKMYPEISRNDILSVERSTYSDIL